MCDWAREHAVEKQLDKFKGCSVCTHITQGAGAIAADGDADAIRIILLWPHFTYHHGVADFFSFVGWEVVIVLRKKVLVSATRFVLGEAPEPMPWHSRPSLLA